ncbi:MAG: citrate synthase [Gemmatimonadetes bacterium]|nr:citrate synthase [Gemmatimonadota bacterium]
MTTKGLADVVAAETRLSEVLGEEGRLIYAGYEIQDLAAATSYEEVCHLLWYDDLPTAAQLAALRERFDAALAVDAGVIDVVRHAGAATHPMSVLRTGISALAFQDPDAEDTSAAASERKAVRLTAQTIALTAAIARLRAGHEPVAPKRGLGLAANFLYMLNGREADAVSVRAMDVAFILHAEHGMNASTFAARVAAGTLADMHGAVTAAVATLKGPLHGGANEGVMRMLMAIGTVEAAGPWVRSALERGERIMGFGHRVYRTLDPRAPILRDLAEEMSTRDGSARWLRISDRVQQVMREEMNRLGKAIYPNVDFYSAPVYSTLGVPTELFTNIFACARMAGWTAHVIEQQKDNRLIRPRSTYVGRDARVVEPIAERG